MGRSLPSACSWLKVGISGWLESGIFLSCTTACTCAKVEDCQAFFIWVSHCHEVSFPWSGWNKIQCFIEGPPPFEMTIYDTPNNSQEQRAGQELQERRRIFNDSLSENILSKQAAHFFISTFFLQISMISVILFPARRQFRIMKSRSRNWSRMSPFSNQASH